MDVRMSDRTRDMLWELCIVGFGVAAFFVFAGWWVLIPTNISWLETGDRAMHTMGWFYYRDAPWGVPPGSSPGLGLELASSIALVDGLPIFAMPFKLLSVLLPRPFQYWGLWWLVCFALQSLFGYRLARALRAPPAVAALAAAFVVITPAFLYRLPLHMALAGHWLILAALWLYVRHAPPRAWAWPLLCGVTAAIHPYLLAMVVAIWFASLVQRWIVGTSPIRRLAAEAVVIALVLAAVLWAVGFFYTGSVADVGFGFYRLNLLGPVITHGVWSQWVPPLQHSNYDYEGLSFLGVGIFGALAVAVLSGSVVDLRRMFSRRWWPLTLLLLLFTLFALSNTVGLLNRETDPIPLPPLLAGIGATFRSSGRFVWPLLYVVTVAAVVLAARRLTIRVAVPLLALLFAAQLYDSRQGWGEFRAFVPAPATVWHTALKSPFWDRAVAAGFDKIRASRRKPRVTDWKDIEYFAYTHGVQTDDAYLARVDEAALNALEAREHTQMASGSLEAHTLYLLDYAGATRVSPHLAPDDLFAVIDNRIVYARHGAALVNGLGVAPQGAKAIQPWVPASLVPLILD